MTSENKVLRWGVIGTGRITDGTVAALKGTEGCELYAVASRTEERAQAFCQKWGCPVSYTNYDLFFDDPMIDAVYVATPHVSHAELSIRALLHGKHVLVEKPAAVNLREFGAVVEAARASGRFFMEGLWTRFLPGFAAALDVVRSGALGEVEAMYADFCFDGSGWPDSRLFLPELAGGALLDVGVYTLTAAFSVAAAVGGLPFSKAVPVKTASLCRKTVSGVDGFDSILMGFASGFSAMLTASINQGCGNHFKSMRVVGTNGTLYLPEFWMPVTVNVLNEDGSIRESTPYPFRINGYECEFAEAVRCVREGRKESPVHTWADTAHLLETMDALRAEWGIRYPFEARTGGAGGSAAGGAKLAADGVVVKGPAAGNASGGAGAQKPGAGTKAAKNAAQSPKEIVVYTDGACSGNPGRGGWGTVILVDGKETRLSGGEKLTTNNRMELMAAIEGLEAVLENKAWKNCPVTVVSDSQYVKNGIQSWTKGWKKNGWRTASKEPVKNKDLWLELDEAAAALKIEWRWVKGHAGNKYNEICDQLAVEAAKKV